MTRISQNIAAANTHRYFSRSHDQLASSLEKLASGLRINRAADDASGLVKSEALRAEINGTAQAIRNSQDAVSFLRTAEGALSSVLAMLQRMRTLALDAANVATTTGESQQAEVDQLLGELDSIGAKTSFAGSQVFQDYSSSFLTFHVGAGAGATNQLSITKDLGLASNDVFSVDLTRVDLVANADSSIKRITFAIRNVARARARFGSAQNRVEHTITSLLVAQENLAVSESRIRDTEMALEITRFARHQLMTQAGAAILVQANQEPRRMLSLLG